MRPRARPEPMQLVAAGYWRVTMALGSAPALALAHNYTLLYIHQGAWLGSWRLF